MSRGPAATGARSVAATMAALFCCRAPALSIAAYIKTIGRGARGARSLAVDEAHDLFAQVLDRRVSDLEIGAFALAMRIKGESVDELLGFAQALQSRCRPVAANRPVLVIASTNGARRLPNLTPLLALLLARAGAAVLVHGPLHEAGRVTSAEIFAALGLAAVDDSAAANACWQRGQPAFIPTAVLSPALQTLLDVRQQVGVRNSGHTLAKLLQPVSGAPALRLASHTHPEFGRLLADWAQRSAADLMLLRGTEGEPVADARRCPAITTWLAGVSADDCSCPAQEGSLTALPSLPGAIDAESTARWTQAALAGDTPLPAPIVRQVELLQRALTRLAHAPCAA